MFFWILTVRDAMREPVARGALRSAAVLLLTGVLFYVLVEGWTFVDALYFCVTTLTTVGFGDPVPTTDLGKIFTVVFVLSGVGMFLAVLNSIGKVAVQNQIKSLDERARKRRGDGEPEAADQPDQPAGSGSALFSSKPESPAD